MGASPGSALGRSHANSAVIAAMSSTATTLNIVARCRDANGSWIIRISPKISPCSTLRRMKRCPDTWARVVGSNRRGE